MNRTEKIAKHKKVMTENRDWGIIAITYIVLLLGILLLGIFGLLYYVEDNSAKIFIFETMIESSFDGLVVGFIVFAISNAFSKLSENTKKLEESKNN